MSNNTTFPTSHYQPYDHSISDPSHYAHRRSKNELPGLEPDTPYGTTYFLLDTHHSGQDSDRPDALSGSSDWEFITHWTSEVTTPSSHVVLGGVDVLGVTPATYPTYSVGPHTPVSSSHFSCHTVLWGGVPTTYRGRICTPDLGPTLTPPSSRSAGRQRGRWQLV